MKNMTEARDTNRTHGPMMRWKGGYGHNRRERTEKIFRIVFGNLETLPNADNIERIDRLTVTNGTSESNVVNARADAAAGRRASRTRASTRVTVYRKSKRASVIFFLGNSLSRHLTLDMRSPVLIRALEKKPRTGGAFSTTALRH